MIYNRKILCYFLSSGDVFAMSDAGVIKGEDCRGIINPLDSTKKPSMLKSQCYILRLILMMTLTKDSRTLKLVTRLLN